MKGTDIYKFLEGLEMCAEYKGNRFTFAVTENKMILRDKIKAMEKAQEPDLEFKHFQDELEVLYKKHAEKDDKGNPKTRMLRIGRTRKSTQYIIPGMNDPESEYEKELAALKEKHSEAFQAQEVKEKEYQEFLEEDIEVTITKIHVDKVPNDLPQFIMEQIRWMVYSDDKK